jgi:glycosyltransferase involved in cell wall biosynthesis
VSAARYEPFGLAVLEAAQAGCALVVSDIPSFRELWEGAALFVAPDADAALAAAVDSLITDPALRDSLAEAARERARRYSADRMVEGTAAVYRDTLGQSARRARVLSESLAS